MSKPKWREVKQPKADVCYLCVIDDARGTIHFFKTRSEAFEYSSWHNIPDCNVYEESDD